MFKFHKLLKLCIQITNYCTTYYVLLGSSQSKIQDQFSIHFVFLLKFNDLNEI